MDVHYHVGFTSILAAVLYSVFGWKVVFLFIGGVLVDADHYLWYAYKYRDWNIARCYIKFSKEGAKNNYREFDGILLIFHTVEFIIGLITLSFFSELPLLILIGYAGHALLDFIWHYNVPKRIISSPSILFWLWKNKIKTVK